MLKYVFSKPPMHIKIGLSLAALIWGFNLYKSFETELYPVVESFQIIDVERTRDNIRIAGLMSKVRDCEFIELLAYSGGALVDLQFTESKTNVSRVEGKQAWGWWVITPPVSELTLYSRHECATGNVLTRLFDGEIM